MSDKTYREFWIEKEPIGSSGCFKAFFYDDPGIFKGDHENLIHAIEKQAYTDALKMLDEMAGALDIADSHLCERIIDPCGFDPKKETRADLITLVIGLSGDNEILLKKVRQALESYRNFKVELDSKGEG